MPDYGIVDTHVHFWDTTRVPIDWHARVPAMARRFGPEDLAEHAGDVAIERLVFVEADVSPGANIAEAEWITELAAADPRIQAIVAHAPLEQGAEVEGDLAKLAEIPLVRGIRRLLQDEADDAYCLRPGFIEGVKLLPAHDLHFEICIYHRQFAATLDFVAQCPEVRMVLNHIGKPGIRDGITEPWRQQMHDLAGCDNVVCKLSGVATEADHANRSEGQLRPYIDHALDCFGPDRVMFGGDWPVATLAVAYPRWVEIVDRALKALPEADRRKVWRDNAIAYYGLG